MVDPICQQDITSKGRVCCCKKTSSWCRMHSFWWQPGKYTHMGQLELGDVVYCALAESKIAPADFPRPRSAFAFLHLLRCLKFGQSLTLPALSMCWEVAVLVVFCKSLFFSRDEMTARPDVSPVMSMFPAQRNRQRCRHPGVHQALASSASSASVFKV